MATQDGGEQVDDRKRAGKRGLLDTGTDERFVRRVPGARFREFDDVSRVSGGRPAERPIPRRNRAKATRGTDRRVRG
jgi:hypothetical protein